MSRESGSEHGQRTVADLLAQYGGSGDAAPRRRRRRAEEDEDSAPRTIIQRVLSDSGQLLPIRDEPGGHRPGSGGGPQPPQPGLQPGQPQPGQPQPGQQDQQPGRPQQQPGHHAQRPGPPAQLGTGRRSAPGPAPGPPTGRGPAPASKPAAFKPPGPQQPAQQPPTPQQPAQGPPALQQSTPSRPTEIRPPEARGGDQGGTTYARPVSPPGSGQSLKPQPPKPQPPTGTSPAPNQQTARPPAQAASSRPSVPVVGPGTPWPADAGRGSRPAPPAGPPLSRGALPPVTVNPMAPAGPANPISPPSRPAPPARPGQPPAGRPEGPATEIHPQVEDGHPDQEYPAAAYPGEDSDDPGRRPESPIATGLGPARPEPLTQEFPPMPEGPPNRPPLRGRPGPASGPPPLAESTQARPGPYYDDQDDYPAEFPDRDLDARSAGPGVDIGRRLAGEDEPHDADADFFGSPENRLADERAQDEHHSFDSFGEHDPFDEHDQHGDRDEHDDRDEHGDRDEHDEEDEPERSSARQWLTMIAQVGAGAVAGAAVFLGFSWLWGRTPGVALAAALVVIVGLVLVVRKLRHAEDLQTTLLAILAGLVVTVSPAALLLLRR